MTDNQTEKLNTIIQKLDQLLNRRMELSFQTPAFPIDKLDKIIQILERLEAKGEKST
jgi:hypothetical protein